MFCPDCGAKVVEGRMFCGKCGRPLRATAASENHVDAIAQAPTLPTSPQRKAIYALVVLLAILGGVGWWWFHRPTLPYKVQDPGIYPFQALGADGKTQKWGFIDAEGNVIVQPVWDADGSSLLLGQTVFCNEGVCGVEKDGKWGFVDKIGNLVISNQFDLLGPFVEGLARVKLGNQFGFIDKTGQYIVNPQFQSAGNFHDGLAAAETEGAWGFINRAGAFVITPHFQSADADGFSEGLAGVCLGGKCGYIDRSGSFAINPQFASVDTFSDGLARVQINGKWGYINPGGKIVINPQFDDATTFSGGLAVVVVSGNSGTINKQGRYVVNPGQYFMERIDGHLTRGDIQPVGGSFGMGLLSRAGNWVLKPSEALTAVYWPLGGKVFYGRVGNQDVLVPVSVSGRILAGWYKGATLDSLGPVIHSENSALSSMHALIKSEASYSAGYPATGFAASISALGPARETANGDHAGLIDADLATGSKDGYQFAISIPAGTSTAGTNFNFFLVAKPAAARAGRSFCADSSGTIHYTVQGEECTLTSPTLGD